MELVEARVAMLFAAEATPTTATEVLKRFKSRLARFCTSPAPSKTPQDELIKQPHVR